MNILAGRAWTLHTSTYATQNHKHNSHGADRKLFFLTVSVHVLETSVVAWTRQIKEVLQLDPETALKSGTHPGPQVSYGILASWHAMCYHACTCEAANFEGIT
jgi:hypothetical protein